MNVDDLEPTDEDVNGIEEGEPRCSRQPPPTVTSTPRHYQSPRQRRARSKRVEQNHVMQPDLALSLFFEPPEKSLWSESLRWRVDRLFMPNDDTSKALAFDYRGALASARKSPMNNIDNLPEPALITENCHDLLKNKSVAVVDFNDDVMPKNVFLVKKPTTKLSAKPKVVVLQRPSSSKNENDTPPPNPSVQFANDVEAMTLLEQFTTSFDLDAFDEALRQCIRSAELIYTAVLELVSSHHPPPELRYNVFNKFASHLEKAFLKVKSKSKRSDVDIGNLSLSVATTELDKLKLLSKCFKKFVVECRNAHDRFMNNVKMLVKDVRFLAPVPCDLSSERLGLISLKHLNGVEADKERLELISDFLYNDFMAFGYIEMALMKTFKIRRQCSDLLSSNFPSDQFNTAMSFFTKAAVLKPEKMSPFLAMRNACSDESQLEPMLLSFFAYLRDSSNNRFISLELRNLSRLYTGFYPIFAAAYDDVFNANGRQWAPIRGTGKQRWLVPDGVNDPLFDPDAATRLANNMAKFCFAGQEKEFKFYFYWCGIRLLTFLGYKTLHKLDLDRFDLNILVAMGGLATGLSAGMAHLGHLTLLSRFLICVATSCSDQASENSSVDSKQPLRTACRLIVEFLAVLVKQLNKVMGEVADLARNLMAGEVAMDLLKFLPPVLVLSYWMANFRLFHEVEVWKRKWSLDTNLLEDLWPEMATLANTLFSVNSKWNLFDYIHVGNEVEGDTVYYVPEIVNSFGCSDVFGDHGPRFTASVDRRKSPDMDIDVDIRLFCLLQIVTSLANRGDYFTQNYGMFRGQSDATRVLVPEPEYIEVPSMLPVPLTEIIECVHRRRTEVPAEQAKELTDLVHLAQQVEENEAEAKEVMSNLAVVIKPQYVVVDTNVFIDALDLVLDLVRDKFLTVAIPTPVISELRGLQHRTNSPCTDEFQAKSVSIAAVRCLSTLEALTETNVKLLLCNGSLMNFDPKFHERLNDTNNDRLIIDAARTLSLRVSAQSHRVPCGEVWVYRNVLLLSRDRIMMLLASAHLLPSLDIHTFHRWAGFRRLPTAPSST